MTEAALPYTFYFDDFQVGQTMEMGTYAVTEDEILAFARSTTRSRFMSTRRRPGAASTAASFPAAG